LRPGVAAKRHWWRRTPLAALCLARSLAFFDAARLWQLVRRNEAMPAMEEAWPILVCTRNDALGSVVQATAPERRKDLVFLQNGMLEPWLAGQGLSEATQVLVYFAVAKLGELPTDGKTDTNPEGLTAACGPWAEAVAARLHRQGLACHVLPKPAFRASMYEKLIWISAFMLVGVSHGPTCSVGDVERSHTAEVCALIDELAAGVEARERGAVTFAPELASRLCAYARSVAHFPTAVKEFEWRNGFFWSLSQEALTQGQADPFPRHTALLKAVKAV